MQEGHYTNPVKFDPIWTFTQHIQTLCTAVNIDSYCTLTKTKKLNVGSLTLIANLITS